MKLSLISGISKIKNGVEIDDITESDRLILNAVYHEYQETLLRSSMIDFDDMISLFIKLIEIDSNYKQICQYKHVLVDEIYSKNDDREIRRLKET